jgi:hypothetical protein
MRCRDDSDEDEEIANFVRRLLEKYLPHPMQSCKEGLIPFPHADLLSLIDKSRDKNKYFSTCMHLARYTTSVYARCSTTNHVYQDLCQKIKIKCRVSMSQQEISDPWPSIHWCLRINP